MLYQLTISYLEAEDHDAIQAIFPKDRLIAFLFQQGLDFPSVKAVLTGETIAPHQDKPLAYTAERL